jgi:hypothetical protein
MNGCMRVYVHFDILLFRNYLTFYGRIITYYHQEHRSITHANAHRHILVIFIDNLFSNIQTQWLFIIFITLFSLRVTMHCAIQTPCANGITHEYWPVCIICYDFLWRNRCYKTCHFKHLMTVVCVKYTFRQKWRATQYFFQFLFFYFFNDLRSWCQNAFLVILHYGLNHWLQCESCLKLIMKKKLSSIKNKEIF